MVHGRPPDGRRFDQPVGGFALSASGRWSPCCCRCSTPEKYLAAAIDSILRQTYRDLELIVIDDGSVDGSAGIISACTDPRLVAIRNETNLGVVAALNRGLAHARGDLVARMDADDVADLQRIEKQVDYCLRHTNVVALGTAITYIDDDGQVTGHPGRLALGPAVMRWRLLRGTCLSTRR